MLEMPALATEGPAESARSNTRRFSPRLIAALIWCGGVGLLLWQVWRQRSFAHDDAFISLRYVTHLVQFGELTWNPGERVEGYTNFLQILATALLVKLGLDPLDAVRSINIVAVCGLFFSSFFGARRIAPHDPVAAAVGGFLVLSTGSIALWIFGGLETVMVTALIACAITVILPVLRANERPHARSLSAGLLIGLAYLTRPDALIAGGAMFITLCCFAPGNRSHGLRSGALLGLSTATIVLAHLAWRLYYYGDPLPNTFYAKVALPLLERLAIGGAYCAAALFLLPATLLSIVGLVWTIRSRAVNPTIWLLATTVLGFFLYVLWVGGDHMAGARLLVPVVAPASLLVVASLTASTDHSWRTALAAAAIVFGSVGAITFQHWRIDTSAFVGPLVGRYISEAWPPGTLVALHAAGATPFYAPQLRFIDMLGLNDRTIAHRSPVPLRTPWQRVPGHAKGDGAYVLSRAPSFIIAGPAEGGLVEKPWFLSDVELGESEEFRRCYAAETTEIPYPEDVARLRPDMPRPLIFTYYRRICQPAGQS